MAASKTQALKLLVRMASDQEFIQYLEHLESSRSNRPLHQLAENTDALLDTLQSVRNTFWKGTTSTTALAFAAAGNDLTLSSGDLRLYYPALLGDGGGSVAQFNTVTEVHLNVAIATLAGGVLAADCWLVAQVTRVAGPVTAVNAYQSTAALITAMQADPGMATNFFPLAYCDGATRLYLFGAHTWLAAGESLRAGLQEYIGQVEFDTVHDDMVQAKATFMVGTLVSGLPVSFSWNATTGVLSWNGTWFLRGPANTTRANGPFLNRILLGNKTLSNPGDIVWAVLDKADTVGASVITISTAASLPLVGRDGFYVFGMRGDDDRFYLRNGTVIEDGGSATLGGNPVGVAWYLGGVWNGGVAPMPLATQAGDGTDLALSGVAGPASYRVGGHHIAVYVDGERQKGGLYANNAVALADSARYLEIDGGGGMGTSLQWVTGVDPNGVTISPPTSTSFIEVLLPAGTGIGTPGKWQAIQILVLSGITTDLPPGFPAAGASALYTVDKATGSAAPDPNWYGLADHAGTYLKVFHNIVGGGAEQTSTADGDGTFTSTGGVVNDTTSRYDPISGLITLNFVGPNREITKVEYYYLTAPLTEPYRVEGDTSGLSLPILVRGGLSLGNYYAAHIDGDDRTTLVLDASVAGGVSSLNALSGALTLAAGTGIDVAAPPGAIVTVSTKDTIPQVSATRGGPTGSASQALNGAFGAGAGDPSNLNPYVAANSTLVGTTAAQKAGFQGLLTASPLLGAKAPLLGLEAFLEALHTEGIQVFARPAATDDTGTDTVRVDLAGVILAPYRHADRKLDLHAFRPGTVLSRVITGNVVGGALAAGGGQWLWVYLVEQNPDSYTDFRATITDATAWLRYSLKAPTRLGNGVFYGRMVYPDGTADLGGLNGVPLGCFLTRSATQVYSNQSFDYDRGYLSLGFRDPAVNRFFTKTFAGASAQRYTLAPGTSGYLGLNSDATRPLLPEDASNLPTHVRGFRIRVEWTPASVNSYLNSRFEGGDFTGATVFPTLETVRVMPGATKQVDVPLDLWLPQTDQPSVGRDYGDVDLLLNMVDGGGTVDLYLEGIYFRHGFWSAS